MKAEDFKVRLKVSTLSIYTLSTLLLGNNSFRINHPFMLYQSFPLPKKSLGRLTLSLAQEISTLK